MDSDRGSGIGDPTVEVLAALCWRHRKVPDSSRHSGIRPPTFGPLRLFAEDIRASDPRSPIPDPRLDHFLVGSFAGSTYVVDDGP